MSKLKVRLHQKTQKEDKKPCLEPCPIERGMRILGGKWTGSILWHLHANTLRFNEIARQLPGASKKVLSERLKQMEANQLITRRVMSTKPFAVSYSITPRGQNAIKTLIELKTWSIDQAI